MSDDHVPPDMLQALVVEAQDHLAGLARVLGRLAPQAIPLPRRVGGGRHELTEREQAIVALLVRGYSNRRISKDLRTSEATVKNQLRTVFLKLGVTNRTQAVVEVMRECGTSSRSGWEPAGPPDSGPGEVAL